MPENGGGGIRNPKTPLTTSKQHSDKTITKSTQHQTDNDFTNPINKQNVTDSTHNHNTTLRQKCAICVHQNQTDPGLTEIVTVWPELTEHIKAAIKALIQTHNIR